MESHRVIYWRSRSQSESPLEDESKKKKKKVLENITERPLKEEHPMETQAEELLKQGQALAGSRPTIHVQIASHSKKTIAMKRRRSVARLCTDHGLVAVESYHVKPEVAPLLECIFTKHGDIAKDCNLHSPFIVRFYLELACSVLQTLQSSKFTSITSDELHMMLNHVKDLENVNFNVGWLRRKVSYIMEMKEFVMSYGDKRSRLREDEKELEALQLKLKERKDKYDEEYQKLQSMKCRVNYAYEKELVDGLL